ncbi:MAG: LON peptidase substrate-binding domain-containing protein [Rhizobiales bacterium]|nr:LON peptidase substrate-binding domain-containing protein [Hyphomicrobiales bacterium]
MKVGNCPYDSPEDLPAVIPVFPLPAALLLPRAELPLNIFEPRYVAMVDAALAGNRVIGMIQPDEAKGPGTLGPTLCRIGCAGRLTSFAETGDGRYMVTLTGIARFAIIDELATTTMYRQCRVSAARFAADFAGPGDGPEVDRSSVLKTFRDYLEAHNLEADWDSVGQASNETLVNTLAMMAPFGTAEKQALLEAPDLRARAETLVALTEMSLARHGSGTSHSLQ